MPIFRYLHAYEDFYRKLGSSMGTRPGRTRHSSGRGIMSYRARDGIPKSPRCDRKEEKKEKEEPEKVEEKDEKKKDEKEKDKKEEENKVTYSVLYLKVYLSGTKAKNCQFSWLC